MTDFGQAARTTASNGRTIVALGVSVAVILSYELDWPIFWTLFSAALASSFLGMWLMDRTLRRYGL